MTNFMLIMLLSPVINYGLKSLTKRDFQILLILLLVYNIFSFVNLQHNGGSNFIGLLTIYIAGQYCKHYAFSISKSKALLIFIFSYLMQVGVMYGCSKFWPHLLFRFLNYNTPFLMLMSVMLFFAVKGLKPVAVPWLNEILRPTLFIYLITDGLYKPFYTWIADLLNSNIYLGCTAFFASIFCCLLLGYLIMRISDILIKYTVTVYHKFLF